MVKKLYLVLCIAFFAFRSYAQLGCNLQNTATADTTIPCSQNCVSLKLNFTDIKQTTDYSLIQSQYLPYPYVCPSDTALTTLYIDDKFSQVINIPFAFCFYGQSYNQVVIGSNGVITFDIANAGCGNAYTLTSGETIPRANGTICGGIGTPYYPRACIMGAYYDIDPSASSGTFIGRRISYYFTGIAPNRKMVVVYYNVPLYSCNSAIANQEIVLYESTGIVDVHIGNKPACTAWNGNRAILGIQNWDRTIGLAAPGKNCTQWTASNETYRFIPSGAGASLFRKIELYQNGNYIDTGIVVIGPNGDLQATFPNVCFNTDTAVYKAVAYYTSCANPNNLVGYETNITVRHNGNLAVTAGFAPASCSSGGLGIVTVSSPVGTGYQYSINGGTTYQPSPVFTAPGGTYSILVKNTQTGCVGSTSVTVPVVESVKFTTSTTDATCYGTATGQALVITQAGASPFQFSSDSGLTYQSSNILFLTAGTHTIRVKDNNGCTRDTVISISQPDSIHIAPPVINGAYCSGNPDGQITITASGGTPTYRYSLINTASAYQTGNTLAANVGTFTVYVKDSKNCMDSALNITVPLNDTMRLTALPDTSVCLGKSVTLLPVTNATQFSWSPNLFISDTTSPRPVVSPQDTTTYYLTARLGTLCSRRDTFDVNVFKRPIVDAGPDTTICFGTYAYFHASAIRGNKYRWSPAAGLSSSVIPNPRVSIYVPVTYTVEVTDPYGCGFKEYDTVRLTVRPKVRAFAGQDTTATLGQPVQLTGCCMDIYQWTPSSIFVSDTARNPIGNFPPGTTQVVMVTTTPEGCEGRDTVLVKGYIGPTYYVPSAFSPGNQDGRNDVFRPIPVGIVETYYFNVYNRYGQMIYTTKTFLQGWDGKWKGELQPEAAYVWMVKGIGYDGKIVEKKGTVILMR